MASPVPPCTGRRDNLVRRVGKLFNFISDAFASDAGPLSSGQGQELSTLLRNHLLPNPSYAQRATVTTFQSGLATHGNSYAHSSMHSSVPSHCPLLYT